MRRGEARLRTLHRDMKAQQDKAELHSKFSAQYLSELEDLRTKHSALQVTPPLPQLDSTTLAVAHALLLCVNLFGALVSPRPPPTTELTTLAVVLAACCVCYWFSWPHGSCCIESSCIPIAAGSYLIS